jgi:hypothetical protein
MVGLVPGATSDDHGLIDHRCVSLDDPKETSQLEGVCGACVGRIRAGIPEGCVVWTPDRFTLQGQRFQGLA